MADININLKTARYIMFYMGEEMTADIGDTLGEWSVRCHSRTKINYCIARALNEDFDSYTLYFKTFNKTKIKKAEDFTSLYDGGRVNINPINIRLRVEKFNG